MTTDWNNCGSHLDLACSASPQGMTTLWLSWAVLPQQDIVEFLKEAEDAIRSFHATQAGAC